MPVVPEILAKCGYLSGIDFHFPEQDRKTGALTGAPITWEDLPDDRLTICYGANGVTTKETPVPIDTHGQRYAYPKTNDKGEAFFDLVPNNEVIPGVGIPLRRDGTHARLRERRRDGGAPRSVLLERRTAQVHLVPLPHRPPPRARLPVPCPHAVHVHTRTSETGQDRPSSAPERRGRTGQDASAGRPRSSREPQHRRSPGASPRNSARR